MTQDNLQNYLRAMVSSALERLTDDEVAQLHLCVMQGLSPKHLPCYKKVSVLFTEKDGTLMHQECAQVWTGAVLRRLE